MRIAVRVGPGRAHQVGRRAGADRRRWAAAAHARARAIAAAIARAFHFVVDEGDPAGERTRRGRFQRGQIGETHDLAFDRARGAAAKRGQGERLRVGAKHARVFAATLPLRERHRLDPHLVEAQLAEFRLRPRHRACVGLAAGHARPDLGGQRFGDAITQIAGQCRLTQLRGVGDRRCGDVRIARAGRGVVDSQHRGETHGHGRGQQ